MAFGCHIWLTFTILINQICGLGLCWTMFDPWAVFRNEQPTVMDVAYVLCETFTVISCHVSSQPISICCIFFPNQPWQPFKVRWLIHVPPDFRWKNHYVLPTKCTFVFCVDQKKTAIFLSLFIPRVLTEILIRHTKECAFDT